MAALMAAFGLFAIPLSLPVLPPAQTAAFAARLGVTSATQTNQGVVLELPQDSGFSYACGGQAAKFKEREQAIHRGLAEGAVAASPLPERDKGDLAQIEDLFAEPWVVDDGSARDLVVLEAQNLEMKL